MDITDTKILVACLFGIVRFLCGLLPIKLNKVLRLTDVEENGGAFERQQKVNHGLAMFQAFGGGVIFAMCFLHMMPEVYESTIELKKFGMIQNNYPFSQLVVCLGFFLVYFVEELAQYLITRVPDAPQQKDSSEGEHRIESARTVTPSNKVTPEIRTIIDEMPTPTKEHPDDVEQNNEVNMLKTETAFEEQEKVEESYGFETQQDMQQVEELDKIMEQKTKSQQQILRGVLIVITLSLHALFEGLAIGLQTSISNIWYLFIAVSIHSATVLFCISMELLLAKVRLRVIIVHVLILSITSPLGVFLGLLITLRTDMESKSKSVAIVFLEGLSAGTITYITFFEVLIREKTRRMCRMKRAFFIILGFLLMACLETWEVYY